MTISQIIQTKKFLVEKTRFNHITINIFPGKLKNGWSDGPVPLEEKTLVSTPPKLTAAFKKLCMPLISRRCF